MKKLVFSLALVFGATSIAQAQYKPEAGAKNLEVNFAPLGGTPVSIPGIKFRSFNANNNALRLGVFIGYQNSSRVTQEEDFDDDNEQIALELMEKSNSFTIAIQPGYEWHMAGTERLSPYTGVFANIGYTSNTETTESQTVVGDFGDTDLFLADQVDKSGTLNLGLNLVAGFDYYFAQNLYIGSEIGFGFAMSNDLKNKTTVNSTRPNSDNTAFIQYSEETEGVMNNTKGMQIGPNVVGQIRVGWIF